MRHPPSDTPATEIRALTEAVERLHGVKASFVSSIYVNEQFQGATVWQGVVSQFQLHGHPTAAFCYAWLVPADAEHGERFYAVLHTPEVNSPANAVRASIVTDSRA